LNILTIESATDIELISISTGRENFQFVRETGLSHSTGMFGNISSLIKEAGISISDIDLLGVGTGPGSFTGIRIAVSTARMFSQILSVPLVGVKSHEIYAASFSAKAEGLTAVAFDAKKNRVYAGLYKTAPGRLPEVLMEPCDITPGDFIKRIPPCAAIHCIGEGFERFMNVFDELSAINGICSTYARGFAPSGRAASALVLTKYNASPEKFSHYSATVPSYERLSDAETALAEKK